MAEATLEFKKAQQQRESQVVDKNGNPNFMTLSDDIGILGKDIIKRTSSKMLDSEVSQRFTNDFGNFVANQQVLSLKKARNQQISYSRASLDKGLGSLMAQGISDDIDNLKSYENSGQQLLNDSLQGGFISHEEYNKMSADFSTAMREGAIQNSIDNEPARAAQILQSSPEQLGISSKSKTELDSALDAKIKSDKIQALKAAKSAQVQSLNDQALLVQDLETKSEAGVLREDELLKQKNKLEPIAFSQLKRKFLSDAKKRTKKNAELSKISNIISKGISADKFKPALIDDHYERMVAAQDGILGKASTLAEKAPIAASYNSKVRSFAKEVNGSILDGNKEQVADAVSAYTYIRDRKLPTLDGNTFNKQAQEIAEYAELLNEKAGLSLEDAATLAKEKVLSTDEIARQNRAKEFRANKDFKLTNIKETAADDLGAENFLGFNKPITDDAAISYKRLVEVAYENTGDEDAARKIASTQMNKTHGVSQINPVEIYMFAPPEQMFPGVSTEAMRTQLSTDITPILPEGITSENVQVVSDDITRGNFINIKREGIEGVTKQELVSYGLQYQRKIEGTETSISVPLVNPETGELVRWFPDTAKISEEERTKAVSEAAAKDVRGRGKSTAEKSVEKLADEPGII
jgi:hypothetical protein